MQTFIKIAFRNIIRNRKRSLITISAVGFGLGALIFIWSFVEGAHRQMIENYTSLLTSHIQIHQAGFHQQNKLELNIADAPALLATVRQVPEVLAAAPRVKADGLISSSEASSGVLIMGIDPELEPTVSSIGRKVIGGGFIEDAASDQMVLGKTLARNLNVAIGDKLVIMSQALDGSIAAGAFHIQGLMDTGAEEIDKGVVLVPLKTMQDLFVMPGRVSEIAVRVRSGAEAPRAAAVLRGVLPAGLEVLPWQQVSPMMQQWIEFDNAFIWIIVLVVMIIVAIGILNTVLMGVLERTREFGILLALGTTHKEIVAMVAWESVFLGLIGSLSGMALGLALSGYFSQAGINLSIFTSALNSLYMDAVVYPAIDMHYVLISVLLVLTTSVVVSIYPAWHAANLKPVEAIRAI